MSKKRTKTSERERKKLRLKRGLRLKTKQGRGVSSGHLNLQLTDLEAIVEQTKLTSVSYTHLTLPTIYSV